MQTSRKIRRRLRVKRGVRKKIFGTSDRPRLSVYRSNRHVYGQLVDDVSGHTVAAASSLEADVSGESPVAVGQAVGARLAERAIEAGVKTAVFDRNGFRYHGRIKALADGVRAGGLVI